MASLPGMAGPGMAGMPGMRPTGTAPAGLTAEAGRAGDGVWPRVCEQFALRVLAAVYQMSSQLEAAEAEEENPERLEKLYRIDHANARIRRQAENLQVLAGHKVEDAGRQVTHLLDVVRAAASAIEHYPRVHFGSMAELAVVEFAADDVIRVLTELLDNATRFSPPSSTVRVSAHITELGSVLVRVEDSGVGLGAVRLAALNAMFEADYPAVLSGNPDSHIGLLVVQRLALMHRMRVRLNGRQPGGTTATVLIPDGLICEVPPLPDDPPPASAKEPSGQFDTSDGYRGRAPVADGQPHQYQQQPGGPNDGADEYPSLQLSTAAGLPRRPRTSLRDQPTAGGFGIDATNGTAPSLGPTNGNPPGGFGGGLPTAGPAAGGRKAGIAAVFGQAAPDADRIPWPDETADFAAGISDAHDAAESDAAESDTFDAFGGDVHTTFGDQGFEGTDR
ncbi:hypothetical protein Raf01_62120 [Rugosimonospora africana]|uniref:histidine kinase n=2 Tax=Rugosimonospora africana TaxID=556532 RepID=A0A8J3VTC2_9ACTN|nr:hypothetical protein Raf01_62120 [Rugosimonospora africana]